MKKVSALLILVFFHITVSSQVVLTQGETFTYEFSSVLFGAPTAGSGGPSIGSYFLGAGSVTPETRLRIEGFENSVTESPLFSVFGNGFGGGGGGTAFGAWQDLQGVLRVTALSETIVLDRLSMVINRPAPGGTGAETFSAVIVVPEPSVGALLAASGIASVAVWRARIVALAAYPSRKLPKLIVVRSLTTAWRDKKQTACGLIG